MVVSTKKKTKPAAPAVQSTAQEGTADTSKVDLRWVHVDAIEPNDYNPNEMDERLFDELAADIGDEELDQPVVVRPHPTKNGCFLIVDGEHRWRASKIKGLTEVPISVRDYTEEEAMIKTVRRNMIHGELNVAKFSNMLRRLDDNGISPERARELMAMNPRQFDKSWKGQTSKTAERAEKLIENAEVGVQITTFVANLSQMIRDIVEQDGDTMAQGYIAFSFRGQSCLMISMDKALHKIVSEYMQTVQEDEKDQAAISADLQSMFKAVLNGA